MIFPSATQLTISHCRQQLQELEQESGGGAAAEVTKKRTSFRLGDDPKSDESSDDEDPDDGADDPSLLDPRRMASELQISQKDEAAFDAFRRREQGEEESGQRRTLADIIMEKIEERKTEIQTQFTDADSRGREQLDPKVVEMYEGVGKVLEKYRSGKVPKAFKVIPMFVNWEELALLTRPDQWSAAAVFRATK